METRTYGFVVVGSGMGGSTLALELAKRGRDVLVLEKGVKETRIGKIRDTLRYFDLDPVTQMPRRSKEGVILWRTFMAGGSTAVSCGNGVRSLQAEMAERSVDLGQDFSDIENDLHVAPIDERLLSDGSRALAAAGGELGFDFRLMPKFIDVDKCARCGSCCLGCRTGARWSALEHLRELEERGVEIVYDARIEKVSSRAGRVTGVEGSLRGKILNVSAECVVLCAGGLGTPVILQKSGLEAGDGLFVDLFVNTYATIRGLNLAHEPAMALVDLQFHKEKGFLLSPFINQPRILRGVEGGLALAAASVNDLVGIMAKTTDQRSGRVHADGSVSKPILPADQEKLDEGSAMAREILVKAGANPKGVMVSRVQGAHPGGTAAIGEVVDGNLETKLSGLFCCDASVLPVTPGLPPILTIGALAKYLARRLTG
ncbi:MAG: GMC family oxidoreductase [Thermoleophilia bacterium]|nr:GMC family oxidoreductase [Thermoleophilia bacterium]